MCSNVELQKLTLNRVTDDPSIDAHTGYPRIDRSNDRSTDYNGRNANKLPEPGVLFSSGSTAHDHKNLLVNRYTKTIDKSNLCGASPDFHYVDELRSRVPNSKYNGSRPGAFFPWPRYMAGEKVEKLSRSLSPSTLIGIEMERRPPTNLPGPIKMAFGRAAPGYYAQRYPNEETWFNSNVLHNRVSIPRFGSPSRTLDDYEVCDTRLKQYLSELNELTEYQDKYLAHTPSVKKPVRYY
ncbi:unnamed protein product [Trichobilharzia szidati]|nr:unnamed protein product [Trichobilharzia szidati]